MIGAIGAITGRRHVARTSLSASAKEIRLSRYRHLCVRWHGDRGASRICRTALGGTVLAALMMCAVSILYSSATGRAEAATGAIILVYHRFGPVAADSMTVTTPVFAWQLKYLHDNGYTVVSLRDVVNFVTGAGHLPARAVAITADDGHRTVFTEMKPLVERYRIPVTLFIYPSAISNAPYAMTWEQLADLKTTGLFELESHTYWHPNFQQEKKRLSADAYRDLVDMQLRKSRQVLEHRFDKKIDLLAWPFGIYDDELIAAAANAGYVAAFTIERHNASSQDNVMAIPRFIVTNVDQGKNFEMLVSGKSLQPRGTHAAVGYGSD